MGARLAIFFIFNHFFEVTAARALRLLTYIDPLSLWPYSSGIDSKRCVRKMAIDATTSTSARRESGMNRGLQILALMLVLGSTALAESADRHPLKQGMPEYPAILKKLKIGGTVKLNALVAADGTVKKTKIDGGNPVLAEVASNAVRKWKYAPSSEDTNVPVEMIFDSQSASVSVK